MPERTEQLLRNHFAAYTNFVAQGDMPATGARRVGRQSGRGFASCTRNCSPIPSSVWGVWDPDVSETAVSSYIAAHVIGTGGAPMSPSRARAVLDEIYKEQGMAGCGRQVATRAR